MHSPGYKIYEQQATHFITFSIVDWIDLFIRQVYKDIVTDSIRFCQTNKGLIINAWCIMTSHVHLIGRVADERLSDVIRDLKKFTANKLLAAVESNPVESRKTWMMERFLMHGQANSRNERYQIWQHSNAPIHLYSHWFAMQKLLYVHNNPVKEGWVTNPEDYQYSSARDYANNKNRGLLRLEYL